MPHPVKLQHVFDLALGVALAQRPAILHGALTDKTTVDVEATGNIESIKADTQDQAGIPMIFAESRTEGCRMLVWLQHHCFDLALGVALAQRPKVFRDGVDG